MYQWVRGVLQLLFNFFFSLVKNVLSFVVPGVASKSPHYWHHSIFGLVDFNFLIKQLKYFFGFSHLCLVLLFIISIFIFIIWLSLLFLLLFLFLFPIFFLLVLKLFRIQNYWLIGLKQVDQRAVQHIFIQEFEFGAFWQCEYHILWFEIGVDDAADTMHVV